MKKMSILTDVYNRVCALCPDNLSGSTDWTNLEVSKITERTGITIDEMFRSLTNGKGVPLYKFTGEYVENRTPEEIAEDEEKIPEEPEEATDTDYQNALSELGVNFDEEGNA